MLTPAERVLYLEGFYRAIHELWRCQRELGVAVSNKASPNMLGILDQNMKRAMDRVIAMDDLLLQDDVQRRGG